MSTTKIKTFGAEKISLAFNTVLWLLLLITAIAVFVPLSPTMPASSLDPSWQFGMNQAVAQGFSFGKEVIFTYGPYSSVFTKSYHPATNFMMVSGSLYLALSYWACFVLLMKDVHWCWILAFWIILPGLIFSRDVLLFSLYLRDALLFSLPLLAGLLTFKAISSDGGNLVKGKLAPFYVVLLFATFGLLPLVKGSLLILCGVVTILCSVFFIANRHRILAIICLFSPLVSMLFFWVVSGQPASTLPSYFISMAPILSGYTDAMSVNGNVLEVILFLIAAISLLLAILTQTQLVYASKIFLFCTYFVFLFISFKAGFVRHDDHAIIAGTSILISALLLPFVLNTRIILPVIVSALFVWFYINSYHGNTSPFGVIENIKSTYSLAWSGIKNRIEYRGWTKLEYDDAVQSLREQASFPILQGTTDIYSYNQSYLIASGNSWSPRPILQSYAVYTPALAEINRKHLLGGHAPDNIIFRVEPIDGRIPSIEEGASWPILMVNYQPTRMINDFLFLRKKETIGEIVEPLKLTSEKHTFGEIVLLPQSSQPVFAQIVIKPTILGRVASIFFKPSQLQIMLDLKNGMKKQYRIIVGMAKSGFVISPLIENTSEFGMLYGKSGFLDEKLVKSITIASLDGKTMLWNDEYTVTFSQIRTASEVTLSKNPTK